MFVEINEEGVSGLVFLDFNNLKGDIPQEVFEDGTYVNAMPIQRCQVDHCHGSSESFQEFWPDKWSDRCVSVTGEEQGRIGWVVDVEVVFKGGFRVMGAFLFCPADLFPYGGLLHLEEAEAGHLQILVVMLYGDSVLGDVIGGVEGFEVWEGEFPGVSHSKESGGEAG